MAIPRNLSNFAPKLTSTGGFGSGSASTPTALGTVYGKTDTSGTSPYLTALGYNAGVSNTGTYNVLVGVGAGYSNTSGADNVVVGMNALYSNTTGGNNTAIGRAALNVNTASSNTAVGYNVLAGNTTGGQNVGVGGSHISTSGATLLANTTGSNNTAIGISALRENTTASNNTAVGYQALFANTSGYNNTAVGYQSLTLNTTGYLNTAIGYQAGDNITTGADNVCVGRKAILAAATDNNAVVIGQSSTGKGTSTGYIGVSSGVYQGNNSSSWSTTSDQRLKKNIADNNDGLDKINSIRVRNFEYRIEDEITELPTHCAIKKEGVQLGVIAQELQAVLPECVKQESTGVLSVDTDNLTWYLINAVKELSARVQQLEGN